MGQPEHGDTVLIACRTCDGSGHEELPPAYRDVYALLTFDWQTTTVILGKLENVKQTALANRLVYLNNLGLADSRPNANNYRMNEWRRM